MTEYCPVLRPTFEEFSQPKEYIKSIESIVIKHGICKIIPPPSWNPRHSCVCLCGPGDFMNACKHKAKRDIDSKIDSTNHDPNRFSIQNNSDDYIKSSNNTTPECLCSFNNIFGDDIHDSLINMHANHGNLCSHKKRKESNQTAKTECNPQSFSGLLSKVNLERYHRNQYGNEFLGRTIKQLSMDDINCLVHVYFPYDHLWYEAKIIEINLVSNSCNIQLNDDEIKDEIVTVYPMEITVIKLRNYKVESVYEEQKTDINSSTDTIEPSVKYENESESGSTGIENEYCPTMMGHELSKRLNDIKNIKCFGDMGRIPSNSVNSRVSMDTTTTYADDYDSDSDSDDTSDVMVSDSDIALQNKSMNDTNDKCEYLWNMIIVAPIRQNLYQSITAKGGVYHCINVVEHSLMSVKYFYEKTQKELKNEIKESKKTAEIMKWINKDLIESHFDEIQREWIRNLTFKHPLYGADTIGSLFHSNQVWNFAKLDSILNLISTDIEGVTIPYLYFGSWRSMFTWHIEDRALWSLNYLHFGKPKIWHGVPSSQVQKMEQVMASNFPQNSADCNVFTRHKNSFIVPKILVKNGIKMYKAVQRANEIIIIAPNAYHSGFNLGFNCAEAVNFATLSWIPMAINAPPCKCGMMQSSVYFDIERLINKLQKQYPHVASKIPELPRNYQKLLGKQETKKRDLDSEYVPPKKRQKVLVIKQKDNQRGYFKEEE